MSKDKSDVEVCILGSGVAGATTAYLLAQAGRRVLLIDPAPQPIVQPPAWDILSCWPPGGFHRLVALHGSDVTARVAASRRCGLHQIFDTLRDEGLGVGFRYLPGYLMAEYDMRVGREYEAFLEVGASWLPQLPGPVRAGGCGLRFNEQGRFLLDPYLLGLREAFCRLGGRIVSDSRLRKFSSGYRHEIVLGSGRVIHASVLVVAPPTDLDGLFAMPSIEKARNYGLTLMLENGAPCENGFFLSESGYYALVDRRHDAAYLQVEEHDPSQQRASRSVFARYQALEEWARANFLGLGPVVGQHSRPSAETFDRLPCVGRYTGREGQFERANVYLAAGQSSYCPTMGTVAGMLLRDLILGKSNEFQDIYAPDRVGSDSPLPDFMGETDWMDWMTSQKLECRGQGRVVARTAMFNRYGMESGARYTC